MARYTVNADSFLELPVTTGTVQNISNTDVEISNEQTVGSGIILKAGETFAWNNATVYACARPLLDGGVGLISVVPFNGKGEGGGGSYTLPIATTSVLGGVKSSTADGDVTVNANGTMTINHVGYRKASTAYLVGNIAYHSTLPTGWYLECVTAGTSGSGTLTITSPAIGNTITDGDVTWKIGMPLSLNGGIMTGSILHTGSEWFNIYGGQSSSVPSGIIQLGSATSNGRINFISKSADSTAEFLMYPDGTLKHNNNDLAGSAIVAKLLGQNGYVKYASGLILQWGKVNGDNVVANSQNTVAYNISFNSVANPIIWAITGKSSFSDYRMEIINNWASKSQFSFIPNAKTGCVWFAIGY